MAMRMRTFERLCGSRGKTKTEHHVVSKHKGRIKDRAR